MGKILVGTSSWTDKSLIESGKFYPFSATTPEDRLRFYASQFPLVEIDSSYYGGIPVSGVPRRLDERFAYLAIIRLCAVRPRLIEPWTARSCRYVQSTIVCTWTADARFCEASRTFSQALVAPHAEITAIPAHAMLSGTWRKTNQPKPAAATICR